MLSTDNLQLLLKEKMDYQKIAKKCLYCKYFVDTDCSGDLHAKASHCTLNGAVMVFVDGNGCCKFHTLK